MTVVSTGHRNYDTLDQIDVCGPKSIAAYSFKHFVAGNFRSSIQIIVDQVYDYFAYVHVM